MQVQVTGKHVDVGEALRARVSDDLSNSIEKYFDRGGGAVVVAETEKEIRTMTVAMAVMELDLTESQTIVFRNAAHGGFSVVYRRPDGNIGWIDPDRSKAASGNADTGTNA